MIQAFRRLIVGALFALSLVSAAHGDAAGARLAGRPVIDVLLELRDPGLNFIYSSELVPASMRVLAEPRSTNRLRSRARSWRHTGSRCRSCVPGYTPLFRQRACHGVMSFTDGARRRNRPAGRERKARAAADQRGRLVGRGRAVPDRSGAGGRLHTARRGGRISRRLPNRASRLTHAGTVVELRLQAAATPLAEVVVSTSRYTLDHSRAIDAIGIDGEMLAAQPVLGEDAIRALGRLPGIAQSGLSAQSSIRGGESGELLTLLDGFPLRQAFHLSGYHSVFGVLDPGLIDDAEIYTGGFPVRYGNRMGGVFDLRTIDASHEPQTALGLSVFNAMARHGGRLESAGMDWLGSARVGTLRPFIEAFARDAGRPTYSDVYARTGYGDPDRLRLSANFLWTRDELSISREDQGEEAQIESKNRYLWLRADHDWGNGVEASLWLGISSVSSFRAGSVDNPGIASGAVTDRRSSDYQELRGRIVWQTYPDHWFEGGFELTDESASYHYDAEALYSDAVAALFSRDPLLARTAEVNPDRERVSLFAAHRWQATDALVSELGLRAQRTITVRNDGRELDIRPTLQLALAVRAGDRPAPALGPLSPDRRGP